MIPHAAALMLLGFCVCAEVSRELCFKMAALGSDPAAAGYGRRLVRRPLIWGGIALWAVEALAWVAVLGALPLGLAYPIMAVTYAIVPVAGVLLLGERMSRSQVAGAALVTAGAACIGWSGT